MTSVRPCLNLADLHALVQPHGGLFSAIKECAVGAAEARFVTYVSEVGNVRQISARADRVPAKAALLTGSGTSADREVAAHLALAEGLERYCASVYQKDQFVVATADELGDDALDLTTVPKCSCAELSNPQCPLVEASLQMPIRWVRALRLSDGRVTYVPAVMTYLYCGCAYANERFWLPTSTGCAIAPTFDAALANAVLEVIERDAISLLWLQRLPLPEIQLDIITEALLPLWDRCQSSCDCVEYRFFDATTDVGVPVVFGVQVASDSMSARTLVACSAHLNPEIAIAKVIRDLSAVRHVVTTPRVLPARVEDFVEVTHGAIYMGAAERSDAFNFLLRTDRVCQLSNLQTHEPSDDCRRLEKLLGQLREHRMEVFAVDLTTDEAWRFGLKAVRVIVPRLQPLSFCYRARFLGHERLYEGPTRMGYTPVCESGLNRWPYPFA